ncbi:ABC transporter ATP-binding protein [Primorskyibacter sp. S187A]|uniref:ABC transporter ATP-binding protein n=1 Tax=Primorskyibacter sp. S187A TaxID=3415130 RepID=UPI003C7B6A47
MKANHVLAIEQITRQFSGQNGIRDISLDVRAGERLALLGHNGAGKSTLMKTILGLLPLETGSISIAGHSPGSKPARKAVSYLPESVAFHPSLTGREQLYLFAKLADVPRAQADALLERVGLSDAAGRRIRTYSKGMRQRLGMAQVFLGQPMLALLDEPTSGLDPIARQDLYALVDDLSATGAAVIIASHALTEIEARTDRIAILRAGQLVADAPLEQLTAQAALPTRIRLTAEADAGPLHDRFGGKRINGSRVEFDCQASQKMDRLGEIAALGSAVRDVDITPPSLEDLYRYYSTGGRT